MQMWPRRSQLKLSFTFISCWRGREILRSETAGRTQPDFSPSLESKQYRGFCTHPSDNGGEKRERGVLFSPLFPVCLHTSVTLLPSTCPAKWGRTQAEKSQTKVVKRRRGGEAQGTQLESEWQNKRGGWEWKEREKMQTQMWWPASWDEAGHCHFKNDSNKSDRRKMDLVILAC